MLQPNGENFSPEDPMNALEPAIQKDEKHPIAVINAGPFPAV